MRQHKRNGGMTLVELLVVVTIIGILGSIAVPSYRNYVLRANRTEAKTALLSAAAALERCYTERRTYAASADCPVTNSFTTATGLYQITVNPRDALLFTLTATPQGEQAKDTKCSNFTLDQANTRGVSGSMSTTPRECWGK